MGHQYPGTIAQLGEHLPYKQGVTGSSHVSPTIRGLVVQLVRMPACHAGGRGFESLPGRLYQSDTYNLIFYGIIAQLGEHLPYKQGVTGSSPVNPTSV